MFYVVQLFWCLDTPFKETNFAIKYYIHLLVLCLWERVTKNKSNFKEESLPKLLMNNFCFWIVMLNQNNNATTVWSQLRLHLIRIYNVWTGQHKYCGWWICFSNSAWAGYDSLDLKWTKILDIYIHQSVCKSKLFNESFLP